MAIDLQPILQAALGDGFRVVRELQGGGMSRVFVAEEEALHREIVVKLLPPDLMAGLSVERFRSEIKHAAKLQHPHIVPVLSSGVVSYPDGVRGPYYSMPFIRGETLRARLERSGPLPGEEVRRLLLDVVDALAHAHEQGIVHRDIKPDNVFLVARNALVTDFGVSKALMPSGTAAPVTGVGITLGTPGYMSPEQAAGDPALDHRTDLYAVGVLAYELLTGRRPFEGTSIQTLLVAQATATPVPLGQLRPEVGPGLAAVVMRCLEKRPDDRFASAQALHDALEALPSGTGSGAVLPAGPAVAGRRRLLAGTVLLGLAGLVVLGAWQLRPRKPEGAGPAVGPGHVPSVALLPPGFFRPDGDTGAALADLVDHISTNLSRLEGLKVVNYMSVGALLRNSGTQTYQEIGRLLGVEHLLVFAPRGSSGDSKLAVQLVEAPTNAQLWVTSYAREPANFEAIDADIVARVSHSLLGPVATPKPDIYAVRARRESAHSEYRAGQEALRHRTPEGIAEAIRHFEAAVRLDSTHADAVGRLATALALQLSYGYRTTMASYPTAARALGLAERAVALDPGHGESVGFRAYIEYLTFAPFDSVRADFGRAIALHPGEADVAGWHALLLLREGQIEPSLAEARRALELDPASSARHLTLALAAFGAQRYDLAALEARRAGETEPELRRPRQIEGLALLMLGRPAECVALDLRPYLGTRAMCLRAAGRSAEAAATLDTLRRLVDAPAADENGHFGDVIPVQELATYYAWSGSAPEALRYIRLTFARSPVGLDQRIVQSGIFDRVRGVAGFAAEMTRLQNAVWPKVQAERRKLDANDRTTPLTE